MDDTSAFKRLPGRRYYHPLSFGGGGSGREHPDDLIRDAYAGRRRLTGEEFRRVVAHVANAGFDPVGMRRVRRRLEGIPWKGRILKTGQRQRLLTGEEQYERYEELRSKLKEALPVIEKLNFYRPPVSLDG